MKTVSADVISIFCLDKFAYVRLGFKATNVP